MISQDVVNAMQLLKQAAQLDPYRPHLDKLNAAIVKMDDEILELTANVNGLKFVLKEIQKDDLEHFREK